jgi:hypothetical protein
MEVAPEPVQFGNQTITQKHLYITLFVIGKSPYPLTYFPDYPPANLLGFVSSCELGLPLLWLASPVSTFFWLFGSSAVLILGHACLMEPGVESEYEGVEGV